VGAGSAANSLKAALGSNTTGDNNTAIGRGTLGRNTQGGNNTAVGAIALAQNTTGSGNTVVGYFAGGGVTTASNVICIGASGANVSNSCFIDQIYSNVQPVVGTDPDSVTITSNGRLGRGNVSSRRYKHDIEPMDKVSEGLYALKPVRFRYNKDYDPTQTLAFGLIAEEVAEVYPDWWDAIGRGSQNQCVTSRSTRCYSTSFLKRTAKWKNNKNKSMRSLCSLKNRPHSSKR
jgi:trimeric autotransporter adhesin